LPSGDLFDGERCGASRAENGGHGSRLRQRPGSTSRTTAFHGPKSMCPAVVPMRAK
jgi:hypothetical protein